MIKKRWTVAASIDYKNTEAFQRGDLAMKNMSKEDLRSVGKFFTEAELRKRAQEAISGVAAVTLDIPLLIRLLEYAREEAQGDVPLHKIAENLTMLAAGGVAVLGMDNYPFIIRNVEDQ